MKNKKNISDQYYQLLKSKHIKKLLSVGGELHVASENRSVDDIKILIALGQRYFSEKYAQELNFKWNHPDLISSNCHLNFFGHIQSNKIRKIISLSSSIEGISCYQNAVRFSKIQDEMKLRRRYLMQVNVSREYQKSGCQPEFASNLLDQIKSETNLQIEGVMIIPKKDENPLNDFKWARNFADKNNLEHCAMGMSDDYEVAIECGATIVRIGRLLWHT